MTKAEIKQCPYCAEEIEVDVSKCKFCDEDLNATMPDIESRPHDIGEEQKRLSSQIESYMSTVEEQHRKRGSIGGFFWGPAIMMLLSFILPSSQSKYEGWILLFFVVFGAFIGGALGRAKGFKKKEELKDWLEKSLNQGMPTQELELVRVSLERMKKESNFRFWFGVFGYVFGIILGVYLGMKVFTGASSNKLGFIMGISIISWSSLGSDIGQRIAKK